MEAPRYSQEVPSDAPFQEVFRLISGYRVSQALYVTATLGILNLLADGPQDSDELARATGTHASALSRVLRFLVGAGLFFEVAPRWPRSVSPRRSAVAARTCFS
jgi:DNA-binding HxlR family transcriptional regulator